MTDKTTTKIYSTDLPRLDQVKRDLRKASGEIIYNQDAIRFLISFYLDDLWIKENYDKHIADTGGKD